MHCMTLHTLLFGIVAWGICGAELRLCSSTKDDRIVFPVDNDEPKDYNNNNSNDTLTGNTELPLNVSISTTDELHPSGNSSTITTTELPTLDNRILVDTLPVCREGYQLRAGRCRKPA